MSILKAMYSGVSGLTTESGALATIGDNVANVNTIGFKQSRSIFEDVLGGAVGSGAGSGVRLARTQQNFGQGALLSTGNSTDLALSGDGFFVVNGTVNGVNGNFYTRAGQFVVRQDGTLVNPQGMAVQGYAGNVDGTFSAKMSSVVIPTAPIAPQATENLNLTANLDSGEAVPLTAWDPQNPVRVDDSGTGNFNFSESFTTYDSLGNAHTVDVYFNKTADNAWEYHVIADSDEIAGGVPDTNTEIATGTLTFDGDGALQSTAVTSGGSVDWAGGATPGQAIAFNFGSPISQGGLGRDGVTQFGAPSSTSSRSADGYTAGDLANVTVDADGVVSGTYSNGQTLAMAQLTLAKFRSNDGLGRAGQSLWTDTRSSGNPALGTAGVGGRGSVVSQTLEQSNVDIAAQFVELIQHQRAFSANSKTITTSDEMLQELMMLKR